MSEVVFVRCHSYQPEEVRSAVQRGFRLLNGIESLFQNGEKILIKPNLLSAANPESAVTTHPMVFKAVSEELARFPITLSYGDSPAVSTPLKAAIKTTFHQTAESLGIPMADFMSGKSMSTPEDSLIRKFTIANGVLDADGIISISKLKTHTFTTFTGAIKNQLGCVPGLSKSEFHAQFPDAFDFGRMLVELTKLLNPRLYIMDGIEAMEGNGPSGGTPRSMNVLLFSLDPAALDAMVARLLNMNPSKIPALHWAHRLRLGEIHDIQCNGDPWEDFKPVSFEVPVCSIGPSHPVLARLLREHILPKPHILSGKCTRCGQCTTICPVDPKAIAFQPDQPTPIYSYHHCIRCFCCQEVCPVSAIDVKTPILGRILHRLSPGG